RKPQRGEGPWQLRVHTHGDRLPVLFAQVDADPHAEHLQTIITRPLDPFVSGVVVDARGEPLANTPLQLRKLENAPAMRGPALNVESDADGRLEFFVLPGTEAGTIHLRGSNDLELAENVTIQRGETGVVLRAIALGAFSVEAMLPTHSRNSDLIWELVHAEGTMYAPWRGDLAKGEPLEFKELYPRTYRLRISLPKRTFGPKGPMSAQDRILYRSAPFEVLPGCRADQVRLDAIDLRRSYRRIEVTAQVEGVPTDPSQSTLLFRPTEGESLAFWSPLHVSANSGKRVLLIEARRAIEVAARGYHHHSTLEGPNSRALLRSDVQLMGDQTWQVQLDLIPQPPVQVQFDPEALALAAPYEFHALLQSGEASPASRWIALGSEPRFEPTPVGRVGSNGTVAFPDRGFLPGEKLPDTIYPALVFRPPGTEGSLQQEIDGCYRRGGSPHWSYRVAFTPNEKRIMRDSVESVGWIEFVRQAPVSAGERGALESRSNPRPPLWNHPIKRLRAKGDLPLQVPLEGIQKAKQAIEDRAAPYR
ncbi:MAG: carboxypeptidase-like regulatory domain-containing protein, partial [Planctomycetota bacterium]|nr:carboxypeptidase-like regulatory domain-containing protein [Planctomycetota bacterium]